jgi:hypothetical protein
VAVAQRLNRPFIALSLFAPLCFLIIALDIPRVDINFLFIETFTQGSIFYCNLKGLMMLKFFGEPYGVCSEKHYLRGEKRNESKTVA